MSSSTINTGTVNTTSGGTTFISGTSSGLDTNALIEAAVNQRTIAADRLDVRIENNQARITGYENLTTLANSVRDSLANLRQVYGFSSTSTSVFNRKAGSFTTSVGTGSAANILGVTLADSADTGTYSITVLQRAQAQKVASASQTDSTADLNYTGSFTIGLSGATSATINVAPDASLQDIANAINAQKNTTRVNASVLKVGPNDFQLVLTGADTAKEILVSDTSGTVLQNLGVIDGSGQFLDEVQAAQQAQLELDNVLITRDSNTITDLINGVTFSIKSADPATTIELDVTSDTTEVSEAIQAFADAYNSLRDFVTLNQSVDSNGEVSAEAVLNGDTILQSLSSQIQGLFATQVDTGTDISTLRDIGLTINDSNQIEVDIEELADALANNLQGVRALFETQAVSGNTNFALLSNTSARLFGDISFDVTTDGTNITGVTADGQAGLFDIAGSSIIGKAGTIYEGLRFAYVGTTNTTFTFSIEQGLGDLLSNTINQYTDSLSGLITDEVSRINETNTSLQSQADRIRERAEEFRASLIQRYANFETLLSRSQSTLAQIRAILGTNDDS